MNAFITGSRIYGKPTIKSDVDLVIRCDSSTEEMLRRNGSEPLQEEARAPTVIRFGKLNVIVARSDEEFAVWKLGTEQMRVSGGKYDKAAAKAVFDVLREMVKLDDRSDSGK